MGSVKLVEMDVTPEEFREVQLERFKQWYERDPVFARGVQEIVANGE